MRTELENKIRENFKQLFSEEDIDEYQISCLDGWYDLINETLQKITKLSEEISILQIKEKFDALRIYTKNLKLDNSNYMKILDVIDIAEIKSKTICENCGKPANITSYHGWLKTVCSPCLENFEKMRKE